MEELTKSKTNASQDGGPRPTVVRRASLLRSKTTPEYDSHHLYSPQFMDDHGAHHYHPYSPHPSNESTLHEEETPIDEIETEKGSDYDEDEEEDVEVRDGVLDLHDLESRRTRQSRLARTRSNRSVKDPNLVTWEGEDDPKSPKNWVYSRKWAATIIVSCFTFISPVSSSMVAPALPAMARSLNITSEIEESLILSIFVLAYAIGPLFLGPMSEIYGRVIVLQLANLFYLVFNLACGFANTKGQLIAFRFLAGLGGSAPLALGGGVLSDCWRAEERGRAISIYSLAPLLGPAVGMLLTYAQVSFPSNIIIQVLSPAGLSQKNPLGVGVSGQPASSMLLSRFWASLPCAKLMHQPCLHVKQRLCARKLEIKLFIPNGRHQNERSKLFSRPVLCGHSFCWEHNLSCKSLRYIWPTVTA